MLAFGVSRCMVYAIFHQVCASLVFVLSCRTACGPSHLRPICMLFRIRRLCGSILAAVRGCRHERVCPPRAGMAATSGGGPATCGCARHKRGWPPRAGIAAKSGDGLQERGWPLRAGVAATSGLLGPIDVPGTGGSNQRMLALLMSRREASQLNWRETDSLGLLVPSTHICAASDSRFEMHYETAAAATCDHMKQPTRTCCVGCFM